MENKKFEINEPDIIYEKFEDEIEDMEDGLFDEEKKVSKTVKKEDKVETE